MGIVSLKLWVGVVMMVKMVMLYFVVVVVVVVVGSMSPIRVDF